MGKDGVVFKGAIPHHVILSVVAEIQRHYLPVAAPAVRCTRRTVQVAWGDANASGAVALHDFAQLLAGLQAGGEHALADWMIDFAAGSGEDA